MKSQDSFITFYDRFVTHYNDQGNKLSAFAELSAIRQGIDQQINHTTDAINRLLGNHLFSICSGPSQPGDNVQYDGSRSHLFEKTDDIVDMFQRDWDTADIKESVSQLHSEAGSPETVGESFVFIDSILHLKERKKVLAEQIAALMSVTGRIASQGYPEKPIKKWSELSESERQTIRNVGQFKKSSSFDDKIFRQAKELYKKDSSLSEWEIAGRLSRKNNWKHTGGKHKGKPFSQQLINNRLKANPTKWKH